MFDDIFKLLRKRTPEDLAQEELMEARRELLLAQTNAEYANAMCAFNQARIARLTQLLERGSQIDAKRKKNVLTFPPQC